MVLWISIKNLAVSFRSASAGGFTQQTLQPHFQLRMSCELHWESCKFSQFSRVPSDPKMGFPLTFAPKSRVFVYFSHLCG